MEHFGGPKMEGLGTLKLSPMTKVVISFKSLLRMTCSKIFELDNWSEGLRVPPIVEVFLASREDPKPIWPLVGLLLGSPNRDMIRSNEIEACTSAASIR